MKLDRNGDTDQVRDVTGRLDFTWWTKSRNRRNEMLLYIVLVCQFKILVMNTVFTSLVSSFAIVGIYRPSQIQHGNCLRMNNKE